MVDWATVTSALNLTHAECAARGTAIHVDTYDVVLDLSNAVTDEVTFRSAVTVRFTSKEAESWIDLVADRVESLVVNGQDQPVEQYDGARLPLLGLGADNTVTVVAHCRYSRTGEGLHRFTDPQDGNTYLYTHLEPTDCRRVFACFEQPDLKGRFTFTVTAAREWLIRSGQPEVSRTEGDTTATVTFEQTPPLSSYIVAIAAGPYHLVEEHWSGQGGEVDLGLMCRASMAPHLDVQDIWEITRAGLDFYGREFGVAYPWGKYDQIFVPEYNIGAMENPGLVTFTESYLPRGASTEAQRTSRSEVILHEMAHMWFGDLVTPHWWDDLWLKESFADLMGYQVSQEITRYQGAWTSFALGRKQWAYVQDQYPTTHPVVATIEDLEAARQNFDGITYAKGASVLKQLQAYVGRDAFFSAARGYFAEHAWGTATLADLLGALNRVTDHDLTRWAQLWLQTAGPSTLTPLVSRDSAGRLTSLTIRQGSVDPRDGSIVLRPHQLNVGVYAVDGDRLSRTALVPVTVSGESTPVPQIDGVVADLILLNDGDLTYAVVRLDERSIDAAATHLSTMDDVLARGLVWSALSNAVRDAQLPATRYADFALAQLPKEADGNLLTILTFSLLQMLRTYVPLAERDSYADRIAMMAHEALLDATPGSDAQRIWARFVGRMAAHSDTVHAAVSGLLSGASVPEGLTVDDDLRWDWATGLATRAALDEARLEALRRSDDTMSGQTSYACLRASLPTREAKESAWQELVRGVDLTNDRQRALLAGWNAPAPAVDLHDLDERYFSSIGDWWATQSQGMATRLVSGLFPHADLGDGGPDEHPTVTRAQSWLDRHPDAPAALRRIVIERVDDARRTLRAQAG